jgi:hypothetical protein
MNPVHRRWWYALVFMVGLGLAAVVCGQPQTPAAPSDRLPGRPASPEVMAEIRQALDEALGRFNVKDTAGVLTHVSDQYRAGPLTKAGVAEQLRAFFALNEQVTANVRVESARVAGDTAWVYTTGDIAGRPRWSRRLIPVLSWERELEIARREKAGWRLVGSGP